MGKLSGVLKVTITADYLELKLNELRLTHEYEEKKYQDREEQRRIREQIREEERAQRELEKAQADAEAEEERYQKALAKAREEAAQATGAALEKLTKQIGGFEAKLDEARQKKERAISRAQVTKSGFVYVISNIGSFGEKVYKIGMTRRMEPMERILELGGASVPFPFDLHAMLYSDNAPELENSLHQLFAERRLNRVNPRREFYHNVELDEVEAFVKAKGLSAQFIKDPEAREYRETIAKREQAPTAAPTPAKFSETLFNTATNAN
jgi:chromosome segregation ATPase